MSSTEPYTREQRQVLLDLAWASIRHGLSHGSALRPDAADYELRLREPGACFVTLHKAGALRGCIGSLEAGRPLYRDVADNAYAAAFRDPRFPPLSESEYAQLSLDISVLTPAVEMRIENEGDLLHQLRPGVDGLIIESTGRRATFLPSVWEHLSQAEDFLKQLKQKAGLPTDQAAEGLRAWRYGVQVIS